MKTSEFKGAQYLTAEDLGGRHPTVKIVSYEAREFEDSEGQTKPKPVLYFEGKQKGLALNRTNMELLESCFGSDEMDDWVGHSITLGTEKVRVGGQQTQGIRIYGSPELSETTTVRVNLPRRKPQDYTLRATGPGREQGQPSTPSQQAEAEAADGSPLQAELTDDQ